MPGQPVQTQLETELPAPKQMAQGKRANRKITPGYKATRQKYCNTLILNLVLVSSVEYCNIPGGV